MPCLTTDFPKFQKLIMIKKIILTIAVFVIVACLNAISAQEKEAQNPVIFANVPDIAMLRVGDTYYMSSTTMHMSPGLPIMKSKNLVNWKLVSYAYDTLASVDELNL